VNPGPAGVDVEVVLIRLQAGVLHHRFTRRALTEDERPDDAALHLAQAADGAVCHSTSWRYQDGRVILTYAVVPDPHPSTAAVALTTPSVMCSGDPLWPTPADVHDHHVAAHAVRHLAYLADTDPAIAGMASADAPGGCWATLRAVGGATPAAVHAVAHELAGRLQAG
jgi:hypothetical protein